MKDSLLLLFIAFFISTNSCKNDAPATLPIIKTDGVGYKNDGFGQQYRVWGLITSDGGSSIIEKGVCWSTNESPTISDNKSANTTKDARFLCNIYPWSFRTKYYVRAYATNSVGTAYGGQLSFTTTCIDWHVGSSGFKLSSPSDGATNISTAPNLVWLSDYGSGIGYDVYLSTSPNPKAKVASNVLSKSVKLYDLEVATTYYWRVAINDSTCICGGDTTAVYRFTTQSTQPTFSPPSVSTAVDTSFSSTSVNVGGDVTDDGGAAITDRGIYWGTSPDPEITGTKLQIGNGTGPFSTIISELNPNSIYYQKAYATNKVGTTFGSLVRLHTGSALTSSTVTDIDGNTYHIVVIGTQIWMAENLMTTKYADGTPITLVANQRTWSTQNKISKAYCWYNNDIKNKQTYGALYTWAAAMNGDIGTNAVPSGVQGACPIGWHLPSDAEWTKLVTYLGGEYAAGCKMKERGTAHWIAPNAGATNESGFTALPGGRRHFLGGFEFLGLMGSWWSSTDWLSNESPSRGLWTFSGTISNNDQSPYNSGLSVRCVKD